MYRLVLALLICFCPPLFAQSENDRPEGAEGFHACLRDLADQAAGVGISESLREAVFPGLSYQERVIELDRRQPEFTQTFDQYFEARVTPARVERGREMARDHASLLQRLTHNYGVPGHYLIAFWGLETNFGSYKGSMPTLDSLATLACDYRRSTYFNGEFLNALHVLQRYDLDPGEMRGSWAGAVGHVQFMPSNYLRYGVDGDGDGVVDLWQSIPDALASGANYLRAIGWQAGERWGREVLLPADFPWASSGLDKKRPLSSWREMGLRTTGGAPLPAPEGMEGAVLLPLGSDGPAFIAYHNFEVIMKWNRSQFYALTVGHLADRIAGLTGLARGDFPDVPRLGRSLVIRIQTGLAERGYDVGEADGIMGSLTRAALRRFQSDNGLVADGFPGVETLSLLGMELE